ncbi:hypothetical protein [Hydrogenophaga sp. RWCD_12]|uniref:hypothetical protein n=1 Tax=Hydrogenophaga sp. RWCD_12 TaxID=3391190 RepID=UPI0039854912
MRSGLVAFLCSLLGACVPYPLAYYSPPGQAPITSGPCNTPHSSTTIYTDEHLELKVAFFGSVEPTILLRIKDASVVRFESSEVSVLSATQGAPHKLAIRTYERRGSEVVVIPVTEFVGPTVRTIYSSNPSSLAPDSLKLKMPPVELNGKMLALPDLVLEKQRVVKLVGLCQ